MGWYRTGWDGNGKGRYGEAWDGLAQVVVDWDEMQNPPITTHIVCACPRWIRQQLPGMFRLAQQGGVLIQQSGRLVDSRGESLRGVSAASALSKTQHPFMPQCPSMHHCPSETPCPVSVSAAVPVPVPSPLRVDPTQSPPLTSL